jgi:hypothetical protein
VARKCLEEILSLQDATDIPSPKRLEVVFQSATEALSWLSDAAGSWGSRSSGTSARLRERHRP